MAAVQTKVRAGPPALPVEWWQQVAAWPVAWLAAHPVFAARWARVRAVGLWVALVWILALLVLVPSVRGSVRAYAGSVVLLVVWFLLARTKTVSWQMTARVFSACVAWSAVIGWFTLFVAGRLDLSAGSDGSSMALAGFLEESGKLVPLLVLVVFAPGWVRRLAATDWALLGFTSGVAFTAYEDSLRQIALQRSIFGWLNPGLRYSLNPWASGGFVSSDGVAVSSGHHIWTATTAMGIGLGITLWRSRHRWARAAAFVLPIAVVVLAIAEHSSFNAHNQDSSWPGDGGEGFSPVLSGLWSATGHGHLSGPLSVVLLVCCLGVDVQRRHRAALLAPAVEGVRPRPVGSLTDREPGLRALAWWHEQTSGFTGPNAKPLGPPAQVAARVIGDAGTVVIRAGAQWSADVAVVVAAHARVGDEPRHTAIQRGRSVTVKVRGIRAEAMTATTPGTEPAARRTFTLIGAVLGVVALGVCVVWGAQMAAAIGQSLTTGGDSTYLAGLLDAVGSWWNGLNPWQQIAVGAGIAALIALSGGSLGLAFGVSGIATYGLAKAHGAATFTRNPAAATTSYLTTTTPLEALLDTGEFALTFAPANIAGAAAGRTARQLGEELARDPAAFTAARRAALQGDAGIVTPEMFLGRHPIDLTDSSHLAALSKADEFAANARYEQLPLSHVRAQGAARDFQIAAYGENERGISLGERIVYPDGFTGQYGALGDAKYSTQGRSWYVPDSLNSPGIAAIATKRMDRALVRFAEAANAFGGNGVIEITTNNPQAATVFEARMRALGIRGYARLIPPGAP